ncbi:MAG TPA: MMPL family transporter, partial [Thermoplasmata archaeon]|nr:MMPL family transporter [Thermoplasmata archaeon]
LATAAALEWGPVAAFLANWSAAVAAHPGSDPASANPAALATTQAGFANDSTALAVLDAFYGAPGAPGFNGTDDCASDPANVTACADAAARATLPAVLASAVPPAEAPVAAGALADLGVLNFTDPAAEAAAVDDVLADESGLPAAWLGTVGDAFPTHVATVQAVAAWAGAISTGTPVASWPLPAPEAIRSPYVDAADDATLVVVDFTEPSGFTTADGATPVHDEVAALNGLVPPVVAAHDPSGTVSVLQTGPAALDAEEASDLSSDLAVVLPLTVGVLVLISMLYFRSPVVPLVTFAALGLALALGLGGVVLLGTLVTHVDPTSLTLENTFVLGVGTDYAIFLVARYREELHGGASSSEAIVTSVTWAGQSIATSGATAVLATLALAFSGVALLSQWGMVLSLAVLIAVLVALTVVPALLALFGPRVFWPATRERIARDGATVAARVAEERTYFYRAGRRVARHPVAVIGVILLVSAPLVAVAATSGTSYDFYAQLPAGHPAADGLARLAATFGPGFAFPLTLLVTFDGPVLPAAGPNATEFATLDALTALLNGTAGVASVDSPIGPAGAPLATWLAFDTLPPATRAELNETGRSFVGSDGRTVVLTVQPGAPGLSGSAVALLGTLRSEVGAFAADHPAIASTAFGGGAAVTSDIQASTAAATERMAILVAVGLVLVLLAVLRSIVVPLLAVATIGLSIGWAWGITNLVVADLLARPLFYFVPTVLFILILGLGIDYNIFLLTRVREERLRGRPPVDATVHAVGRTGGIISAAAVILASAFAILATGDFLLLQAIGFSVAVAIVLDATVVRTYLVPAALVLLGRRSGGPAPRAGDAPPP